MNCYENIPAELKKLNQWVCTRGNSKVPMKAWENEAASSTNPQTWADFDTAHKSVSDGHYDYCGFVFNDNGFVGVDIDMGYDEDGLLSPLAADIIGKCRSYTEKSKSGRGFHILLKGDLPFKGKNNLAGVEIYKSSRYFIMTGDTLLFRTIEDNQSAIEYIVEKYFPETQREKDTVAYGGRIYCPIWEMPENNFSPSEQDTHLKDELTSLDAMSGIFMWLVRGYIKYKENGLAMSKSLSEVVERYERDNDLVLQFLENRCVRVPEDEENPNGEKNKRTLIKAKDLYSAFKLWAKSEGAYVLSARKFNSEMERHPEWFDRKSTSSGFMIYWGLKLKEVV